MRIVGVIGGRLSTRFAAIWMRLRSVEVLCSSFAILNPAMSGWVYSQEIQNALHNYQTWMMGSGRGFLPYWRTSCCNMRVSYPRRSVSVADDSSTITVTSNQVLSSHNVELTSHRLETVLL